MPPYLRLVHPARRYERRGIAAAFAFGRVGCTVRSGGVMGSGDDCGTLADDADRNDASRVIRVLVNKEPRQQISCRGSFAYQPARRSHAGTA